MKIYYRPLCFQIIYEIKYIYLVKYIDKVNVL